MPIGADSNPSIPEGLRDSLPRTRAADSVTATAGTVALSLLPVVGSAVATTFLSAVQAVSQREMERWLARMAEIVDSLSHILGISVEQVVGDGQFFESLVRASRAAQETTEPEKLEFLGNAVSHSGSWTHHGPLLERTLMRLATQLEPEQVEVLRIVNDPAGYAVLHPELGEEYSLTDAYVTVMQASEAGLRDVVGRQLNDLYATGLLAAGFGPDFAPLRDDTNGFALTTLGNALLSFVSPPSGQR